ncbi:MAG: cytochrome c-type biogenesis protein [Pseudomonadota bacterium]
MRFILLTVCLLAAPALAVEPDEMLADPMLEQRARDISGGLRCLVCRNESIDESSAGISRDLRILVRERLVAGDTDEQVVTYIVDRYGEYVLLNPKATGSSLLLWLAGPFMFILGAGISFAYIRGRARANTGDVDALTLEEQARLREILED